jgi:hypothetical protein
MEGLGGVVFASVEAAIHEILATAPEGLEAGGYHQGRRDRRMAIYPSLAPRS